MCRVFMEVSLHRHVVEIPGGGQADPALQPSNHVIGLAGDQPLLRGPP